MRVLDWDSDFFGVPIGRADDGELTEGALDAAREAGLACVYLAIPGDDVAAVQALVRRGARLVDFRVELERRGPPSEPAAGIRRATSDDADTVAAALTSLAAYSRFSADDRFDRERVRDMYRAWGASLLDGGVVVVPEQGGGVVAASDAGERVRLDLVWVEPGVEGRGLGRALIQTALALGGREQAVVTTQAGNVPALRLYEGCGFKARTVQAILHVWLDELR